MKIARGPTVPSRWEKERHDVTHVPYRSWCPICVSGRGVKSPHKINTGRKYEELPRFSMDYGFMGQEEQRSAVLLVVRELKTAMMFGMLVPKKGVGDEWVERRVAHFINSFGYKTVILRTDNENSILALRKRIAALVDHQVIEEDAIKGESQTNGLAEVGIKIVEGLARTLKIDVEEKHKFQIANDSVVLAWLLEHACTI